MNKSEITYNVEQAIQHDQTAIETLYKFTYAAAYAFTYNLCHNHNDVEDILQESYFSAFANLYKIKNKGNIWNWLKGIILNKWRDYCREISVSYDVIVYESIVNDDIEYWQLQASVQNLVEDYELSRIIRETVEQLPEKQRVCAVLYYYDNYTMDEIAGKLKIPLGSVKSRLYYARKKIENILKQENMLAAGSVISAAAEGSDLLSKILTALEGYSTVSTTVKTAGGGIFLKMVIVFVSASVVTGITGAAMAIPKKNMPETKPSVTVTFNASSPSTTVTTTRTTEATTSETTSVSSAVTTTASQPKKYVSFEYTSTDTGVCITKYTGNEENVSIPTELDGKRVVAVGRKAFAKCTLLRSVIIPDCVSSIGVDAFRECGNLSSISLGSVSDIGDMAFVGCDSLKSVYLPPDVRSVGIYAFAYCSSLEKVVISQGTKTIRYNAFCECPKLSSVTLPPSVSKIGAKVFEGDSADLVLHVAKGSYSHQYAVESLITYEFD